MVKGALRCIGRVIAFDSGWEIDRLARPGVSNWALRIEKMLSTYLYSTAIGVHSSRETRITSRAKEAGDKIQRVENKHEGGCGGMNR